MTYTIRINSAGTSAIIRDADGASIPDDPANADYRAYLAWVDEGGVAEVDEAESPPPPPPTVVVSQSGVPLTIGVTEDGVVTATPVAP